VIAPDVYTPVSTSVDTNLAWITVPLARDIHESSHRGKNHVVARPVPVGAVLPVRGDGSVDKARIEFVKSIVVQTEALGQSRGEVLDKDVGYFHQLANKLLPRRFLEVDDDRPFVPVAADVIRAFTSGERRSPGARIIANIRTLHLDHVSALVPQDHSAIWSGQNPGQIENPVTTQRKFVFGRCVHYGHLAWVEFDYASSHASNN
jgi:hypothetical protein